MRNCSPPDERRPQGPQTHRQTLIMSSLSSVSGTKLSPHAQNCPFQPVLPEQGELCTARTTTTPSRENFVPHPAPNPAQNSPSTPTPAAQPVQNSPSTPTPAAQPVQNSPNTRKIAHFSPFCPSRENFVPPPPPRPPAGRTLYRTQRQTRHKTLPTHPHQQPNRYKTLPTHPQMPISARFTRAGRTLYRSHHQEAEQGELCTAPSAKPGTKLSQHTHTSSPTGTKLSQHTQKGPFQPVLHEQGELCTAPSAKPGTKLSQRPVLQRFREKVRPAHPKTAFFASFAPAGRIFSRTSKQQATQGELFRALGIEQGVLTKVVCADI